MFRIRKRKSNSSICGALSELAAGSSDRYYSKRWWKSATSKVIFWTTGAKAPILRMFSEMWPLTQPRWCWDTWRRLLSHQWSGLCNVLEVVSKWNYNDVKEWGAEAVLMTRKVVINTTLSKTINSSTVNHQAPGRPTVLNVFLNGLIWFALLLLTLRY